jgi:hypothetical protein
MPAKAVDQRARRMRHVHVENEGEKVRMTKGQLYGQIALVIVIIAAIISAAFFAI